MNTIYSKIVNKFVNSQSFLQVSNLSALICGPMLRTLFLEAEFIRATGNQRKTRDALALASAGIPFLLVLGSIIVLRFLRLSS